jgi:hypothetical protein
MAVHFSRVTYLRLPEDPPSAGPHPHQERAGEPNGTEQRDDWIHDDPRLERGEQIWRQHRRIQRLRQGIAAVRQRGQREEQQRDHQHGPVLPPKGPDADEQQYAVQGQDVADVEQHRVNESQHHQEETPPPEQPPGRSPRTPGLRLPPRNLRHPVPEEEPEHRPRPPVDQGRDQQLHRFVGRRPAHRESAEHRVAAQEVVRVRQRDEQQHESPGQIRSQRPRPQPSRPALRKVTPPLNATP